jgi:eukaryotic-like serine/threonine-protein kinase
MTLTSGTKIGAYEITAEIGTGGMGEVYRARDAKLGRDVAIKVLPASFAREAERMARFEREAKVLASLNHPNIAAIYGFEDSGATHGQVMELVEGPTLADRLGGPTTATSPTPIAPKPGATQTSQARPIPVEEALRIARQMADALEYAHERGIVHRDLKPANIKISRDDAVKILDFGLAKAVEGDASSMDMANSPTLSHMATQAGVLLGTAAYMSPEQAKAKPVDRRADIWAFGCVLYEMLTGKVAFHGETVTDTLAAAIRAEPDWSQLPAETPIRVRVLLQRCLQKDPKQRLQAIGDARISLDEVLSGAADPAFAGAAAAAPRWRRALPWAVAAGLGVALAALGWAYARSAGAPARPEAVVRFRIPATESTPTGGAFAVSPDGHRLAFSGGSPKIWVRELDSFDGRAIVLPASSQAPASLFWSPDGRYIGYGENSSPGKLIRVDVSTGETENLCDVPGPPVLGASWNADGTIIFGQASGAIMKVPASGGIASPVTEVDGSRGEVDHLFPTFLPDERHFIYLRSSTDARFNGIYIGSIDDKPGAQNLNRLQESETSAEYVPSADPEWGQLLFVLNGALMAQRFDVRRMKLVDEPVIVADRVGTFRAGSLFQASKDVLLYKTSVTTGNAQLAWFDRQGKSAGTVGDASAAYASVSISPDGKRVLESRFDQTLVVWQDDLATGTSTRFTFGSAYAVGGAWSPDGSQIVFSSSPKGVFDLYQKPANGAHEGELLLHTDESKTATDWSRDGRFVLYNSTNPQTKNDIWVLPLAGDKKPAPFLKTEYNEAGGHFSPGGRFVAYQSDESGRDEIYVRTFSPDALASGEATGGKWQVSTEGGTEPRWRRDGKELYFISGDGKLMAADVNVGSNFQSAAPKALFSLSGIGASPGIFPAWDAAPDGTRFLFPKVEGREDDTPLNVVLNWQVGLKK